MKGPKGNKIKQLHTGEMIQQVLKKKRVSHAALARLIGQHQSNIRRMLNNDTIQVYLLWELSIVLRHNFFSDLAQQLNEASEKPLDSSQGEEAATIEALQKEVKTLREERDYLRKALDLVSGGQ